MFGCGENPILRWRRMIAPPLALFRGNPHIVLIPRLSPLTDILLHSALYTVSFYKALWTSGYTSRAIGWGNPLAGECVTLLSNSAVTILEEG